VGDVELHLLQGLGEKDVKLASTVDEDLVELGARDHRLQDEWESPWFGEASPLFRAGEGNGYLRPPERGRDHWFNAHNFSTGSLLFRLLGSPPKRTLTVLSGSWKSPSPSSFFFLPFVGAEYGPDTNQ
jgi:hypothetical protein